MTTDNNEKSQKQRLEELLTEMGVKFQSVLADDDRLEDPQSTVTRVDEGVGYKNFFCDFTFDGTGKMVKYGCWE